MQNYRFVKASDLVSKYRDRLYVANKAFEYWLTENLTSEEPCVLAAVEKSREIVNMLKAKVIFLEKSKASPVVEFIP